MTGGMGSTERSEQLDTDILNAVADMIGLIIAHGERIAQHMSFPSFFIKALHMLDCPMAMKELGRRLRCDPSFVTVIADGLEKRGLARREAHPGDRRIKNIVLTDAGQEMRQRVEREVAALMPWSTILDLQEREQLLALLRKMASAANAVAPGGNEASRPAPSGEVEDAVSTASAALT
jgi:MarR family transcriptional regulator, organic hydroperoxide resistance regulator